MASIYIQMSVVNRLIASVFVCTIIYFLSKNLSIILLKSTDYYKLIQLMSLIFVFSSVSDSMKLLLEALSKFKSSSNINIVFHVSKIILCIILFLNIGIQGYFIGMLSSYIFLFILLGIKIKKYLFLKVKWIKYSLLVKYSVSYWIKGIFRNITFQADQLIISIFLTPEVLAGFNIAKRYINYLNMIMNSICNPIVNKLMELRKSSDEQINEFYIKFTIILCISIIPLSSIIFANSDLLMYLFGNGKYKLYSSFLEILSLNHILFSIITLVGMGVYAFGKPLHLLGIDLIAGTSTFVITYFLIQNMGLEGVAYGQLLSYLITLIVLISINWKLGLFTIKWGIIFEVVLISFFSISPILFFNYKLDLIIQNIIILIPCFIFMFFYLFNISYYKYYYKKYLQKSLLSFQLK